MSAHILKSNRRDAATAFCLVFAAFAATICGAAYAEESRAGASGSAFRAGAGTARASSATGNPSSGEISRVSSATGTSGETLRTSNGADGTREADAFLCKNARGVQTRYPSVCKIVGRAATKEGEDGALTTPVFYGTGSFVAEYGEYGIVLTNWHVVSEADSGVDAIFPTAGLYPARVILRDETWDLTALLIERPTGLLPVPISLEVPKLGEIFWVGGYGQTSGLDDFQLRSGRLQNYVSLVDPSESLEAETAPTEAGGVDARLPSATVDGGVYLRPPTKFKRALYETLSIKRGVRRGDSGGPIFNRYGELSGVLWGSDGKSTMGTVDLRLQEFLTQAIRRAARYCAERTLDAQESGATFDERQAVSAPLESAVDADGTEISMYDALLRDGVFAISSSSVYVSPDGTTTAETLARCTKEEALKRVVDASLRSARVSENPPYPPIFSPTFVVQQRETKQILPEKIDPQVVARLNEVVLAQVMRERATLDESKSVALETVQTTLAEARTTPVVMKSLDTSETNMEVATDPATRGLVSEDAEAEPENRASGQESSGVTTKATSDEPPSTRASARLSNIQTYVLFCILFIVFYLAARGMNIESESERKKSKKIRLRND